MISSSGHDERNKYSGGAAGDQTGTEWRLMNWYSYPWNCVLRHPDASVRAKLAELHTAAAKNDKIGYDQGQRNTYWTQLQKVGYDPGKITAACEADCSAGVIANVKAVGYLLKMDKLKNVSASYTGNMRSSLQAAGFQVLTGSKYLTTGDYLLAGDILLNDVHHTAVAVSNGAKADIAASTKTEEFEMIRIYQNGSTAEPVYADTAKTVKIGSLNPWETCDCLGKAGNLYIVRYKVDGTSGYKVGLVSYNGGVA